MRRVLVFLCFTALVLNFTIYPVLARQGCCSHHGGVCGCGCCDGTALSAKCAPYYPGCNQYNNMSSNTNYQDKKEIVYVGSSQSNKYHYTWCKWAKKISPEHLVTFKSAADAKSKGYVPCKVCNPAG